MAREGTTLRYRADYVVLRALTDYLWQDCCAGGAVERPPTFALLPQGLTFHRPWDVDATGVPGYLHSKGPTMEPETLKSAVRDRYAGFVTKNQSCCGPSTSCGCAPGDASLDVGYDAE